MTAKVDLFARPTPVESAPRLAELLGMDPSRLLLKRDDLIGLGGGGNKVRKLEVTLAEALRSHDTIVTSGAPQSNHARLTAAAGARLGLKVVLVLAGPEPTHARGNILLERIIGAELLFAGDRNADELAARTAQERGAYLVPFGGTTAASAEAYRLAGLEMLEQVPDLGHAVVAIGSGGTMAGLVAALGPERVLGVDTGAVPDAGRTVTNLLTEMGHHGVDLQIDAGQVGAGYEHLTPGAKEAMILTAQTEGVYLDPTYTGRAMAGLIAATRAGRFKSGTVVFMHTGGLPGLFGHEDSAATWG